MVTGGVYEMVQSHSALFEEELAPGHGFAEL